MNFPKLIGNSTALAAAVTIAALSPVGAEAKDWRGWNIHVVEHSVSHGMEAFMAEVTE